jgi:hypothetical protein
MGSEYQVSDLTVITNTAAAITAIGGLGTAAFGLVDATKAFGGGVSNFGFRHVETALKPFREALQGANADWMLTLKANWINGVAKEDQKAAAKNLIRLGLSSGNATTMAEAGHVDAARLSAIITAIESGGALSTSDAVVLGRFNAAIDAAMDAGFERGDQEYRNAARVTAGIFAIALAVWAGALISTTSAISSHPISFSAYLSSGSVWVAILIGIIAVPIAPIAKDLASSLQAAANAVRSVKS